VSGCCTDKACTPATCMTLPDGARCGNCQNYAQCASAWIAHANRADCDFFPRRFVRNDSELSRLRAENERLRAVVGRVRYWTHLHGVALCPAIGDADSFGDGMRAAKKEVARLLAALDGEGT
jgi:hypothetical protein